MRLSALILMCPAVVALSFSSTNAVTLDEDFSLELPLETPLFLLPDSEPFEADVPTEQPRKHTSSGEPMISMMPIIIPNPNVDFALRIIEPSRDFSSSIRIIERKMITPNIIVQPNPTQ